MDIQTILANLKIEQLNVMQQTAVDAYREGGDLVLLSPTGSGKTLAYLLPLVFFFEARSARSSGCYFSPIPRVGFTDRASI